MVLPTGSSGSGVPATVTPVWSDRRVWLAALVVTTGLLLVVLSHALWRTPYAISESVALLEDVERRPLTSYFDLDGPYVRPAFYVTLAVMLEQAGSLGSALVALKVVHIASVLALATLFLLQLHVRTPAAIAAGIVAASVLIGHGSFRENLENLPLNQMMWVMTLTLLVWRLVERPARWWHGAAIVSLTLLAIGFKEHGILIAPLLVAAWWMGAPGAGRGTVATVALITFVYVGARLSQAGSWEPFPQEVGYGFEMMSGSEAAERFGRAPLLLYLYNVASTAASVLFSEPSAGVFRIVQGVAAGRVEPWQLNHLLSSAMLTGLLLWWAARVVRRDREGRWNAESRLAVAVAIAVAGSAAVGFAYSRDRMGGVAIVFYALAAASALRMAAERLELRSGRTLVAGLAMLLMLAGSWQVRALGTIEYARETADKNRREWIIGAERRRLDFADRPRYLRLMNAMAAQGTARLVGERADYPRWVVRLLGER